MNMPDEAMFLEMIRESREFLRGRGALVLGFLEVLEIPA